MTLPTNIGFGRVVGQWLKAVGDGNDPDSTPDGVPAGGKVTFTPSVARVANASAVPNPVTIIPNPVVCQIDSDGYLVDPQGNPGVWLVATDDTDNNPAGWTYSVKLELTGLLPQTFNISVAQGATADLSLIAPVVSSSGTGIVRGPSGPSAFDTAVANGFVGTESEWLGTLEGPKGDPGPGASDADLAARANDPASEFSAALKATYARAVSLPTSNGTDDTAAIQAILDTHAGKLIVGVGGQNYRISTTLVIRSGTTLDMTGCIITLKAGSECRSLQNAAHQGGAASFTGPRDSNITVRGGTWDRGANSGATVQHTHNIAFHRVDGITFTDARHTSTAGKFAVLLGDVTGFSVERHTFAVYSDGVHMQGPLKSGVVRNIRGATGDDTVAITGRDYPTYDLTPGGGSVSAVTIEDIFCEGGLKQAVKVFAGLNNTVSGVTVQRVHGNVAETGVSLFHDNAVPELLGGAIDGVSIRDIDVTPGAAFAAVLISAPNVSNVLVDGINSHANQGVKFTDTAVVQSLILRNFSAASEYADNLINVLASANITDLTLDGLTLNAKTDMTAGRAVNIAGTVARLTLNNVKMNKGEALGFVSGSCAVVLLNNVETTTQYGIRHTAANAMTVTFVNISFTTTLGVLRVTGTTGASGTIQGSGIRSTTAAVIRGGTQTLRVNAAQARADIAILTPQAGDQVYNTNAAAATGVGPSLYTPALAWKNLAA